MDSPSRNEECRRIERAFQSRFGKLPDVRFHDGHYCLWKEPTLCTAIPYYTLSQNAEYALSFVNTILIQIPSAIAVFDTQGEKRRAILAQNQIEMNKLFDKTESSDGYHEDTI